MIIDEKNVESFPSSRILKDEAPKRIPLSSRPADLLYFAFFLCHIPPTLVLDLQAIYPEWLLPADSRLRALGTLYMRMTNDPVVGGVGGYFGPQLQTHFLWLRCFMWTEILLQLPMFIYGAYNLYHNSNVTTLYPLLIAYGAGTAMSTLPCLAVLLMTPSIPRNALELGLTYGQRMLLLGSYIPFFIIPLMIFIDMALRTRRLATAGLAALNKPNKWE